MTSIPVQDQAKALAFYTEKLGFVKKEDTPVGEYRWLTVTSPEGVNGVELVLEPLGFAPAKDYYQALYDSGIPAMAFESNDLATEVEQLKAKGVNFRIESQDVGMAMMAIFEDTCGNLICLTQPKD